MYKRLNELNFVIGLFFTIVSLILLVGSFLSSELSRRINVYTGIVFLIFGIVMILIKGNKKQIEQHPSDWALEFRLLLEHFPSVVFFALPKFPSVSPPPSKVVG